MSEREMTFEQAFAELEKVLSRLQEGNLTLEESLALFERGAALVGYCTELLDKAELRVSQLLGNQVVEGDIPMSGEETG